MQEAESNATLLLQYSLQKLSTAMSTIIHAAGHAWPMYGCSAYMLLAVLQYVVLEAALAVQLPMRVLRCACPCQACV